MESKYTMYHRELPIIEFLMSDDGYITDILKVENERHIPLQFLNDGKLDRRDNCYNLIDKILRWKEDRGISSSRKNLKAALKALNVNSSDELAKKALYMSLTDHYWIAPSNMKADWASLNFFDNPFSDDMGKILLGQPTDFSGKEIKARNPSCTSKGELEKAWKIQDGKRILVKGGSSRAQQEPFNEVLASEIFRRLGIPHVEYKLLLHEHNHYCTCEDFADRNHELVSAAELCGDILDSYPGKILTYDQFKERCFKMGIEYDEILIGKMFVIDFLMANTDRHLNNFGFIRNAVTLKWKGFAPIYDTGNSMFKNQTTYELEKIIKGENAPEDARPFASSHRPQLDLFPLPTIFKELDLSNLSGIGTFYRNTLGQSSYEERITDTEKDLLAKVIESRTELLKTISLEHTGHVYAVNPSLTSENPVKNKQAFKNNLIRFWFIETYRGNGRNLDIMHGKVFNKEGISNGHSVDTTPVKSVTINEDEKEYEVQTENTLYHCSFDSINFEEQDKSSFILPDYERIKREYGQPGPLNTPITPSGKVGHGAIGD